MLRRRSRSSSFFIASTCVMNPYPTFDAQMWCWTRIPSDYRMRVDLQALLQVHTNRSHLLNPGIASFSMITGKSSTMSRNQTQKPTIQRRVERKIGTLGGDGRGFDRDRSLNTPDRGTSGSGFERACGRAWREDAARPIVASFGPFLGGTGGALSVVCGFRLRMF
jgi:hypothetical protein